MLDEINEINKFRIFLDDVFDKPIHELNFTLSEDEADPTIEELYSEIVKTCNEGRNIPDTINKILSKYKKSSQDVLDCLSSHQDKPEYICVLALFHYYNVGVKNVEDMYQLFQSASSNENVIATFFVGKCFDEGLSVRRNKSKAIELYKKAEETGNCAAAGYALGSYYYKQSKYNQAFGYLERSARGNNMMALNLLALCYQKSFGTSINKVEAFKSFLQAAKMGLPESQYRLGKCYEFAEGAKRDLEQALHWYQKAMDNEYQCYNDLERVKIAKNQELELNR
ncbi:10491_t:CDS:1 [Racocetra fulgida]|uniref:10491_t:CDS:1 n=1 Tax=Racocetra fulgida TaxID=60492 RepID=A0A9N8WP25_9GLOM|nr:10491_t:CDS:1 [Racocetra fulgida]